MTNECVGACSLHACTSAGMCACVPVGARAAVCLCVFACLSHDVLWQSLTNRTGASRRWRGGARRQWETGMRRGGKRSYGAVEGGHSG